MKKLVAAALILTVFSSYIVPEEKPSANECRLFQDTEFTFSCTGTECSTMKATANGITFTGDAAGMQMLQTPAGKEMMDKMLGQILIECLKGNAQVTNQGATNEKIAEEK